MVVDVIAFVIVGDKREGVVVCGRVMWTNNDWLASYTPLDTFLTIHHLTHLFLSRPLKV